MIVKPIFPTILHQNTAELIRDYFLAISNVDTVLVVNSCARGQAVPESDLDFAILVKSGTSAKEIQEIENAWLKYANIEPSILQYKQSSQFAHLHLDIINGQYTPMIAEAGEPIDYFEVEIGNQVRYAVPMDEAGTYFKELQEKWLPYYAEKLRVERLAMARKACEYDLDHIPFFVQRGLYFHAFDTLCKAFQEYLQALFIANKTYPIAYNKWIKEQVVKWLNLPELYATLPVILSVSNMESQEINDKAKMLRGLLDDINI